VSSPLSLAAVGNASDKPTVVALHGAGGGSHHWRHLVQKLGRRCSVVAPDLNGAARAGRWSGGHRFTASGEAAVIVGIIDASATPVHLVGHCHGGGVALRVARERPGRIASLALYEPTALHVLKTMGPQGRTALGQVKAVSHGIDQAMANGTCRGAAKKLVDYLNGEGAWEAMRRDVQADLVRYMPKASLDLHAMIEEPTPLAAYARFTFPVLLLAGEHACDASQMIVRQLARAMKQASSQTVYGAGHMGPLSHSEVVSTLIAQHIVRSEPRLASEHDLANGLSSAA
jgi:pimeloyl-ACP methyl ester carboxylesterase